MAASVHFGINISLDVQKTWKLQFDVVQKVESFEYFRNKTVNQENLSEFKCEESEKCEVLQKHHKTPWFFNGINAVGRVQIQSNA